MWGVPTDIPFRTILETLRQSGSAVVVVDQTDYSSTEVRLDSAGHSVSGTLEIDGEVIPLECISAAFLRPHDLRRLGQPGAAGEQDPALQHGLGVEEILQIWTEIADTFFVNRLSDMSSNNSKPYQAELIRSAGFNVPDTLITTDPAAVDEFRQIHQEVIYKSISAVRSIVTRLTREHQARLQNVANCPTQFQERVPGIDYRVHVVGERVFSCEVLSDADDYRYAHAEGKSVRITARELPENTAERCLALAAKCNLALAGIDLRLTPSGDWYCFEVNPSPVFTYYQKATGARIDEAIAELLRSR